MSFDTNLLSQGNGGRDTDQDRAQRNSCFHVALHFLVLTSGIEPCPQLAFREERSITKL
jgi:hypothetical protein